MYIRPKGFSLFTAIIIILFFASCEKGRDTAVILPPRGEALHSQVTMGENYTTQLFFDLESQQVVYTSEINSWDLAFEAGETGTHIFINGAKNILVKNTNDTSFARVNSSVYQQIINNSGDSAWKFDWPCMMPDSTAIGDWTDMQGNSRNEVYIVSVDSMFKKVRMRNVNDQNYIMEYGDIDDQTPSVIIIPKNADYNYTYFSFKNAAHLIIPEPPKNTWDIVFTRYRHVYKNLNNFKYQVTGVLLNPYRTTGVGDSTSGFENINMERAISYTLYPWRDVIGFDWKSYDYTSSNARYVVNTKKCYVLRTRKDQYWKLHFLDFYSPTGIKGSPSFEYERMQ